MLYRKWRVAFLCESNTCCSQIAEVLGEKLASDVMECYSAGVEDSKSIKSCVIQMLKETQGIDLMEEGHRPKLISELAQIDIAVYLGGGYFKTSLSN